MLRPVPADGSALPVLPPMRRRARSSGGPHGTRIVRSLAVPLAVVALAVALAGIAIRGSARAQLNVGLAVRSISDPQQIGATTQAEVDVANEGKVAIRPRFSLSWLPYPYYWRVVSGPAVLQPGASALYVIEAPDSVAAPPDGQAFQVHVNDASSIVSVVSTTLQATKPNLPVVNPGLRMWTQRDPSTGVVSPPGWQVYQRKGIGDEMTLGPARTAGVVATHFSVSQDGAAEPDGWAHEGLIQQVPFPQRPFDVRVYSDAPYKTNSAGWPLTAFGLEVTDTRNGRIWFLFQQTGTGNREYDLPNGQHIVVYDIAANRWTSRTIDLAALYQDLNWAPPAHVLLNLFMGVTSAERMTIDGYIAGLSDIASTSRSVP